MPILKGTGSGNVLFCNVVPDGTLNPVSSNSLGSGFVYKFDPDPFTGASSTNGVEQAKAFTASVTPGGSVFPFSGGGTNAVTINATPTVLIADDSHSYIWFVRDQTDGGVALGMYETGAALPTLITNTTTNLSFTRTASGLKCATTGGTTTRTILVMAIRI